jgi:rhodanese-related sulfurtransferase
MYQSYKSESFPDIPDISVEELLKFQKKENVILVDVRNPEEWTISMLPGAITKETFMDNIHHYKEYMIIPYCTIGYRSGLFTKEISKTKLNSKNLRGGVLTWAHAKQKFVNTDGDSQKVHVYGEKWNLLPKGYKAIW